VLVAPEVLIALDMLLAASLKSPCSTQSDTSVWTIVSAVAAVLSLVGIVVAWREFRYTERWNKRNAACEYFPRPHELEDVERELEEVCRFSSRKEPLTKAEAKAMHGETLSSDEIKELRPSPEVASLGTDELIGRYRSAGRQLKYYLSTLERYCAAINTNVVDEPTAMRRFKSRFMKVFGKVETYIRYAQNEKKQERAYSELEDVVGRWS
jgi:uncharacterized protein DUF4760